jgi:hypothetical protein
LLHLLLCAIVCQRLRNRSIDRPRLRAMSRHVCRAAHRAWSLHDGLGVASRALHTFGLPADAPSLVRHPGIPPLETRGTTPTPL